MAMTKARRNLQGRLRRKFGWSTNTNYNRGTILDKQDASTHLWHDPKYVTDLRIDFNDARIWREILEGGDRGVEISLTKYNVNDDETYTKVEALTGYISLAELELICKIAKEKKFEICRDVLNSGCPKTITLEKYICNKFKEDGNALS